MRFLKTNTATRVTVGPFFDKTDGITPETAITVTSCKLTLMVDDGGVPTLVLDTAPTASGGANDMVHVTGDDAGFYDLELAAANVNYVGRAMLAITDTAVHCPVFHEFMILPANVYDSFVGGSDVLDVSVTQWLGTAAATPTVAGVPEVDITHIGGTAVTAAAGIPEVKVASLATGSITAGVIAADAIGASELAADAVAEIVAGVWGADATTYQTQGTFGQAIGDPVADTGTIYKATVTDATGVTVGTDTATLLTRMGTPSDLGGGATLAGNLSDIEGQTDDIGAAGAGLTALASAANLSTLTGYVDTEVAAIKAKTDQLTFTTANQVDAQALSIAANALTAAATASDFGTEVATAVWASATRTLSALGFTLGASDLAADTIGASELAADAITEIVTAVLTTAMTESYNADGAAPTLAQALFVTMQRLTEFAIAGTTVTVKKIDGSTSAYTLTLDDATSPTSTTRAT